MTDDRNRLSVFSSGNSKRRSCGSEDPVLCRPRSVLRPAAVCASLLPKVRWPAGAARASAALRRLSFGSGLVAQPVRARA